MVKRTLFSFVTAGILLSCTSQPRTIVVNNFTDFDRKGEMVEVDLSKTNCDFSNKTFVLKDQNGQEVPYQVLSENDTPRTLLFQADVPAQSASDYSLSEGTPSAVTAKVFARYIPERKDDFAWENDLAAYRMYGPALANEYPSNGVDIWLKRTDELIVDKFYHDELKKGLSYHIDHGLGLDCYKVGHMLGAGGIAPYTDQLWVGNHYDHYEINVAGPLRTVFTLTYDSMQVADSYYKQTVTITVDAGSLLNKATVRLEGPATSDMKLAAGIFLHGEKAVDGITYTELEKNLIGYAERATSDAGVPAGRNYVGVYMPGIDLDTKNEGDHLLILSNYEPGYEFTYYFGGGWSEWKFPTDNDWFKALDNFSQTKACPLSVSFK